MTDIGSPDLSAPRIRRDPSITVAFVNNTSDRALAATEVQFLRLLQQVGVGMNLQVRYFTCPEIRRAVPPRTNAGRLYADTSELLDSRADALVVTGMEPVAAELRDEPVWSSLTELIGWAEHHAVPSIWSCLAAHAAVLHMDAIDRVRHPTKLSDIFSCESLASSMPLMQGLPPRWSVPHSRYYGLPETSLVAKGYRLLSRSAVAGPDLFMKCGRAPFLFFQGHPEYDDNTLLLEYKRDLRRYFFGKRDEYPIAPKSYFDQDTILILERIRMRTLEMGRDPNGLDQALDIAQAGKAPVSWSDLATGVYANWLSLFVLDRGWPRPIPPAHFGTAFSSQWRGTNTVPEALFSK